MLIRFDDVGQRTMRFIVAGAIVIGAIAEAPGAYALKPAPIPAAGSVQYAFTPGDRADEVIIDAIAGAREQVLVQAYSFTHRQIAEALIKAHRRGIEVTVVADREQAAQEERGMVPVIARAGVSVLLDGQHALAHNKVILIDPRSARCAVVTGSYNFTQAAQFRNAENVLVLRDNLVLCEAYRRNWEQHRAHANPLPHYGLSEADTALCRIRNAVLK